MTVTKKRSEKRKRTEIRRARFTPEEAIEFDAKAAAYGGDSAFIRNRTIGAPLPKSRINRGAIAQLRNELAKFRGEFGKIGSNINQIAYRYNISEGRPPDTIEGALFAALQDFQRGIATFDELRLVNLQAVGLEKERKPPKK